MISLVGPTWPAEIYLSAHLSSSAQHFLLPPSPLFTETKHGKYNRGRLHVMSWGLREIARAGIRNTGKLPFENLGFIIKVTSQGKKKVYELINLFFSTNDKRWIYRRISQF